MGICCSPKYISNHIIYRRKVVLSEAKDLKSCWSEINVIYSEALFMTFPMSSYRGTNTQVKGYKEKDICFTSVDLSEMFFFR